MPRHKDRFVKLFFNREVEINTEKNTESSTNTACQPRWLNVEECKYIHTYHLVKNST